MINLYDVYWKRSCVFRWVESMHFLNHWNLSRFVPEEWCELSRLVPIPFLGQCLRER